MAGAHLEVWGDPIGHSRSPQLHLAAYRELGLDWSFTRREVPSERFSEHLAASSARGLAVTYPLKERAFAAGTRRDRRAELTGVANTLLLAHGEGPLAYNTDVGGIVRALGELGLGEAGSVRIVGAGATATSAVAALAETAAEQIEIVARRPERASDAVDLAGGLGLSASARGVDGAFEPVELTIATLPGGTALSDPVADALAGAGGALFDVAYSPWPSPLAARWSREAHHGLGMLLHQALLQVRIFVGGDPAEPLPDEHAVLAAMRAAL
ncbi:MAG TPA: shikimate dehydrogenase [Microbacterium sp.]|nr:shikimate dehydrogenase [Microbacterium sp.]